VIQYKDWMMLRLAFSLLEFVRLALLVVVGLSFVNARVLPAQTMPTVAVASGTAAGDRQLIITGAELGLDKEQPPRLWILGQGEPLAMTGDEKNANRWMANLPAELCKKLRDSLTIVYVEYGTMLAGPIGVPIDDLEPVAYTADLKLTKLPAAIHGTLTGDQTHSATFTGKKGERVQVEIEARRLGGKLRPVIHLYDSRKIQLAWAQSSRTAGGDARLSFVLPSDGDYRVEWHDALFKGEAPGTYRVKVGQYDNIAHQYPLVLDSTNIYEPDFKTQVSQFLDGGTIRFVDSRAAKSITDFAWSSMSSRFSSIPQAVEAQHDDAAMWKHPGIERREVPVGLNGILAQTGEEDRWPIDVEPGKTYRFNVLAAEANSPVDAVMTLYDADGKKQLMTADDAAKSSDPSMEYTVPKDVKKLTIAIKDLLGRGGWEYAYNIEVTDAKAPGVAAAWSEEPVYVPLHGRNITRIKVKRQNYPGKIDYWFNVHYGFQIEPKETEHLVEKHSLTARAHYYIASAKEDDFQMRSQIIREPSPYSRGSQALHLAMFVSDRETPFTLDWSAEPTQLPRGGELKLPVKLTRTAKAKGPVRLSLLTNQPGQTKTIKENNQDKIVPAGEKMLRLEGKAELAADALDGSVTLHVPSDLAQEKYQLALRGELLSPDGKRVIAVTTTTIALPKTVYPLQIALDAAIDPKKPADVRAGTGDTVELKGKIERTLGTATPVRVTVEGWPKDLPPPLVDLTAEQTEFTLPLRLPFKESKAALKDVKLLALAQPSPGPQPGGVRSPAVPLMLRAVAGEKPAQKNGLVLFDEEANFPAKFTVGKGETSLDNQSATRGKVALKFSPPMKAQPNLPEWNFKIRQHPGSGEYRYLRFTWKKQGGGPLGVQLAHDGKFGPVGKDGPSYRYHAGPGNTLGASLTILDNLAPLKAQEVVRDLYADFGEFTLTGFGAVLGDKTQVAYFDEITLGQTLDDLE
jgi:hypothetical protein